MGWVFAALLIVVIGFAFLAAAGRLGEMAPQLDDRPVPALPTDRQLEAADIANVDFAVTPRGYSQPQVDALLARLAQQLTPEPEPEAEPELASRPRPNPNATGWPGQL